MPRLGRRRLDLSLARAPRARLRRLGRPRPPRRARSRCRRRRGALRRGVRRRDRARASRRRPRRRCATLRYAATERLRPAGDRATRPPIRSRRCSTGSSRAARRAGSRCGARTASCARCSTSRARRRARTAPITASTVRIDATNPETARGLIRDEILPLLRRLHPGADANLRALGEERPRLPRALEASLVDLLASRAGSKAADLGGGVRAVREYETPAARGDGGVGAVDARERARRSRGSGAPPGGSSGGPPQEGAGSARGRESAEGRARRLAGRGLRRGGRRRAGDRRRARLGRRRHRPEGRA